MSTGSRFRVRLLDKAKRVIQAGGLFGGFQPKQPKSPWPRNGGTKDPHGLRDAATPAIPRIQLALSRGVHPRAVRKAKIVWLGGNKNIAETGFSAACGQVGNASIGFHNAVACDALCRSGEPSNCRAFFAASFFLSLCRWRCSIWLDRGRRRSEIGKACSDGC
jgi:hypothetical protein